MTLLLWLSLANVMLFILHEMDSVYWKEWDLFGLPGGVRGFLLLHLPLYAVALFGIVRIAQAAPDAIGWSIPIGLAGVAGFLLHGWFLRRGRPEFDTRFSKSLLLIWLLTSLVQLVWTAGLVSAGMS